MAMGRRKDRARTPGLWIATNELPATGAHPFYQRLNRVLDDHAFDAFVEAQCAPFYAATRGRPSLTPGTYFRLLLISYFEGIDSERGIAWRTADSLALRGFLGLSLDQVPPEHSTISRTRRLIDLETHRSVFTWILQVLATADLVKGKTIGIDATTLEANAALRSIMRRDSGETYQDFLTRLAQASGIETPTRADLARLDRKRPKKGRNAEWRHPHDPDARITKMKDGRTHLAHKAEHAVDLETGAIVGVTVQGADQGDTTTIADTVTAAAEDLEAVATATDDHTVVIEEVVADKGGITAIRCSSISPRSTSAPTSRNRTAAGADGRGIRPRVTRCTRIDGASAAGVAGCCSAAGASGWNDRTRISTRPAPCGARTCAVTATS
jgi:transposase